MKALKYTLFLSIAMIIACTKPPDYSDTPEIAFISLSKTSMVAADDLSDNLTLTISFTDGDGDIGIDGGTPSVYFKDLRDGSEFITFVAPVIPEQGVGNGISGEMYIKVSTTCCIHPIDISSGCQSDFSDFPVDSLIYEVYIIDRSGNKSNVIQTDPIVLLCEN